MCRALHRTLVFSTDSRWSLKELAVDKDNLILRGEPPWCKRPECDIGIFTLKNGGACDEITGFIVACTKVRPKGISELKSKSVLKSLKKKSFAASVDRNEIYHGCELINIELKDHIDFIINVLRKNTELLELKT